MAEAIGLKAVINKANNRVLYVEADHDFVDVLFGFLTEPMGEIIRLIRKHTAKVGLSCMDNLYQSVENLDIKYFRMENCKTMLLQPRNAAAVYLKRLKLNFDNGLSLQHYYCRSEECTSKGHKLLSCYSNVKCFCGRQMDREVPLKFGADVVVSDCGGVFVKGLARFLVSDELQVFPASTEASLYLISKHRVKYASDAFDVRDFKVGVPEVLNLLNCSLRCKTAFTETWLHHKNVPKSTEVNSNKGEAKMLREAKHKSESDNGICLKLTIIKSKQMVCYAEGGEDFVNLLFSFLTVPLGYTLKETKGGGSLGCIHYLYRSAQDIDADNLILENTTELLLNPKIAMGFGYPNQQLGVEEIQQQYYNISYGGGWNDLTTDGCGTDLRRTALKIRDPKSLGKEKGGGFLKGPAMFTVTDNLMITPISPSSCLSILGKLNVSFEDIYQQTAFVNKEEASRLLVAALDSDTVLTDVFLRKAEKDAPIFKQPKQET